MKWLTAAGAALLLQFGGPAAAGEARCLWRSLAPASQDRLLAAYARSGADGVVKAELEAAEKRRQLARCVQLGGVVDPKRAVNATEIALEGLAAQEGAIRALTRSGLHTVEQLNAAWTELGPERRALLHAHAEKMVESRGDPLKWSENAGAPLADFLALLGHAPGAPADPALYRQLLSYVAGRSSQEAFETRF